MLTFSQMIRKVGKNTKLEDVQIRPPETVGSDLTQPRLSPRVTAKTLNLV